MVSKQDKNQRNNNNDKIVSPRQSQKTEPARAYEHSQAQNKNYNQNVKGAHNQQNVLHGREGNPNRNVYRERENQPRQYSNSISSSSKYSYRNRAEETIDDIKEDILRIEKEIDMEIKEIKNLKL